MQQIFPATCLAVVCDSLMREERIPFEAFPLTGLQVLGMLEMLDEVSPKGVCRELNEEIRRWKRNAKK